MPLFARLGLPLLLIAPASADQLVLEPTADNTLYESAMGPLSNGAGDSVFAGTTNLSEKRRAVLRFDLAGLIPPGSIITGARVRLECTRANSPVTVQSLHRVLTDWGEGASIAPGAGGSGTAAAPGDATWEHTFFPGLFWTSVGGDFDPAPSASQTILGEDPYDFVSAGLAHDVQNWLDGQAPNHGWMIKDDSEIAGNARRYASREAAAIIRPILVIHFNPPAIGTNYCGPAVANSSGSPAVMSATGGANVGTNNLTLTATSLPSFTTGFFIASETQGFAMNPGGSTGSLCLGGSISRFNAQVQNSGFVGWLTIPVDLTLVPSPGGVTSILAGSTWNFQAWFLDSIGGVPTSNFSDGLTIQFQ